MTDRTRLLVAVCLLEMSSGLPYGIVNELTPTWLAVRHVDLAALGALNLVGLPWTLRAFWAPAVDRYATFRHWMMGALLVCMGATGLLALRAAAAPEVTTAVDVAVPAVAPSFADTVARLAADPFLGPVAGLLLLLAIASATQDVAIDGYIAARVPPAEAGRVNGLRISSYRVAMALAGGLAGWVGATWSWPLAFALLLVPAAVFLVTQARVAPAPRPPHVPTADWWRGLAAWFAQPASLGLLVLLLLFKLGDASMAPMTKPFLLSPTAGLTPQEVTLLVGTMGPFLIPAGALLGGEITSRLGLGWGLLGCGLLQALSNLGYAGAALVGGREAAVAACVGESFTTGLGSAALLALVTRASAGEQTATRFAVCSALMGLTRTLSGSLSGLGAEQLGFPAYFAFTFVLALPALALAPFVARRYAVA